MSDNDTNTTEAPTRRDYVKYGGAVVGGGLLAGCSGDGSGASPTVAETGSGATSTAATTDGDSSYEVCMEPHGCTTFSDVPETYVVDGGAWGDMAIGLGVGDGLVGLMYDNLTTAFYEALPGVSVDSDSNRALHDGEYSFDKEVFYELDPDVIHIDPNAAKHYMGFDDGDIEELSENVGPFVGSWALRPEQWDPGYPFYSLYEAFGKLAQVYHREDRFAALRGIYDDLVSRIESATPNDSPTIGYMNGNPAEETFYVHRPAQPGYQGEVQRHLGVEDAFSGQYPDDQNWFEADYEALLNTDPDTILIKSGFGVHDSQGYDSFQEFVDAIADHEVGGQLTAVREGRVFAGGPIEHGPVHSLFIHEGVAKQLYPDVFGELTYETYSSIIDLPLEEQLFDRQRVADIIDGDL
ncbi:ABC transporter substrate-binding protein [Halobium palmae]|uniref:ABC transporter substrate-binding protein n=1 Tax=Halobium palmae TaxID=1776492 RepID=A0ABD5RX89_9EURY